MRHVGQGLVAVSVVLGLIGPAQALDDVPGWQNTRWGMTEPEVRKALTSLGIRVVPAKSADLPLKGRVPMEGQEFEATFHFIDEPRRLDRVLLKSGELSRSQGAALHAMLLRSLTEMYGQPLDTVSRGTTASMMRWRFRSSAIALSIYTDTSVAGRRPTAVSVMYGSAPSAPSDSSDQKVLALGLLRMLGEVWPPR